MKNLKLFPYQEEGVKHLTSELRYSYLADKPGLGKTIQALTAVKELGAKSLLVLCPASIVNQWQEHIHGMRSATVISYDSIAIGNATKEHYATLKELHATLKELQAEPAPLNARWVQKVSENAKKAGTLERTIKRKEKAKAIRAKLRANGPYDVIICDEAHYLKERGAHRTAYVFHSTYGLITLAKKGILLSGTPMLNRPAELFPVLRACYPEALHDCPTFEAYGYKFCGADWGFNGSTDFSGSSNSEELGKRLEGFMLARGVEVLGERLPGVTYVDNYIPLDTSAIFIDDEEHVATKRRLTGEAKVDKLVADIKQVSETVRKLVVFYYHESVRQALQRVFPHAPLIKGGLTSFQKSQEIERFVKLGSEVMLVQLGAGGVGLDGLQYICNTGYIAELDWTPALEEQAVGRLRRLGQKEHVTIYRPVGTKQGIDQKINTMNKKKGVIIREILQHVTQTEFKESVKKGIITMSEYTEEAVTQLTRIADAVERIADALDGQNPIPQAAPKAEPKVVKTAKPAKKKTMTAEEGKTIIRQEANSDPAKTNAKMAAFKIMRGDWGVANIDEVAADEIEKFVEEALSVMQKAAAAPVDEEI